MIFSTFTLNLGKNAHYLQHFMANKVIWIFGTFSTKITYEKYEKYVANASALARFGICVKFAEFGLNSFQSRNEDRIHYLSLPLFIQFVIVDRFVNVVNINFR